jgi:hypothetical protein
MNGRKEPSLGASWAAQVRVALHTYLPAFHPQSVRGTTFSQGAEVVIRYFDDIPEQRITDVMALAAYRQELAEGASVRIVRQLSPAFLERVAWAYCKGLAYPLPHVLAGADGSAYVQARFLPPDARRGPSPIELSAEIHRWARQLDAGDIANLAFSYSPSYRMVERKRDWSRGRYHDFAVIRKPRVREDQPRRTTTTRSCACGSDSAQVSCASTASPMAG